MDLSTSDLTAMVRERSIIIACGSGGVGKTTTAAALALEGARLGRRACVVTIDPAKRLADALGLESLTNQPNRIEGDWPGELWAMMLDTKGTFDELVHRYATTPAQAEAILSNRLYRNISGALSGTQEYMAMEKLYELHTGPYDLVVVDTPPTRNALDFLDAPRRLTNFLDNRLFRLVVMPTRAYLKAVSAATQAFLRTISRVVGAEVVGDAIAFFEAFEGMEAGFRDRAATVRELLVAPSTAFVLVTSPRPESVEEASFFAGKLDESGITVAALVVNRIHPRFGEPGFGESGFGESGFGESGFGDPGFGDAPSDMAPPAPAPSPSATAEPTTGGLGTGGLGTGGLATLRANLADFRRVAAGEESHFAALAAEVEPGPVARVPFMAGDVHDLAGLDLVGGYLMGRTSV